MAMLTFHSVLKEEDLTPGKMKCVEVDGHKIALYNVDGTVYATDDTCSHAEASLTEGELDGCIVKCPKHGAKFDVKTGQALSLPAWAPVETYEVKVENGEIKVAI